MNLNRISMVFLLIIAFSVVTSAQNEDRIIYLHPTSGGSVLLLKDPDNFDEFWQLIPMHNEQDEERVRSYLKEILVGIEGEVEGLGKMTMLDFLVGLGKYDDEYTDYVFISRKSDEVIHSDPYMNDTIGPVWFDLEKIAREEDAFVSVFYFRRKKHEAFSVTIKIYETEIEMGKDFLLPKAFKKGEPCSTECYPFTINAYGEIYVASFIQRTSKGKDTFENVGFVSYLDSVELHLGAKIGFEYELIDSTKEGTYKFNIIHPEYISGPYKGQTECPTEKEIKFGKVDHIIWEIAEEYELEPGELTIQLFNNLDGLIYEKKFYLYFTEQGDE